MKLWAKKKKTDKNRENEREGEKASKKCPARRVESAKFLETNFHFTLVNNFVLFSVFSFE